MHRDPLRRSEDPLRYAFSGDGRLDPGTKLLDIGLVGYTPVRALKTLVDDPLHMSVRKPFFQYSYAISSKRSKGVWHLEDFKFKPKNRISCEYQNGCL